MKIRQNARYQRRIILAAMAAAVVAVVYIPLQGPSARGQIGVVRGRPMIPAPAPAAPSDPGPVFVPGGDREPGGLMDHAADSGGLVYVDDSFASVEKLRDALREARQGQSQLAINSMQAIINDYGQKLVYLNDNSYMSITDYVRDRMLRLPEIKQGLYDQLQGGTAKKAIDSAIQRHDVAELIRICDRYFPSSAALAGLSQAADWYFERGEFSSASRTWGELLDHPMAGKMQAQLLFRAAVAASLARNQGTARQLRDRLEKEFPGALGVVEGKEQSLLGKLDEIMAMPAWDAVDVMPDEWPAFQGGPSRSRLLNVNASIGARLWVMPFSDDSENASVRPPSDINRRQAMLINGGIVYQGGDPGAGAMSSFAVLSNGALFLHTGERIISVSSNAGALRWKFPLETIPRMDPTLEMQIRNNYGIAPGRLPGHDSPTVFGDQVFAVMPAMQGGGRNSNGMISLPTRVVCIGRDDGREKWSCNADGIKLDNKGALSFVGSPIVTRQGVFVMARKVADATFSQQYLIRLDRGSGAVTWSCYLCSTSNQGNGMPFNILGSVAVPTLVDDIVYICTGQGADCAVDANAGRILWLRVTATGSAGQMMNPQGTSLPAWKSNPPLIWGDKMIACDNSQFLRVYNRWDGRLLAFINSNDFDMPRIDVMAGIIGSHLILSGGKRSLSVDLDSMNPDKLGNASLKRDWWIDVADAGNPEGRPFLTQDAYYVPFESKLIHIDPISGKSESWDWPNTEKDTPGKPGNLLVTSEQVIVVNDNEIAGYSKWETARDNRLARIAEHPGDPEPLLALAEISYRTNHQELAQEYMKKAVDTANGAGGKGPMDEMLQRLYAINLNFAEQLLKKNDPALRDQARFYYEQCRNSARDQEQQSQWRLRLAELSLKQKNAEEAATLYSDVLADPGLRAATYREGDVVESAGACAEQRLRKLIAENGPVVFKRFEDQATALLNKALAQHDLSGLEQVMEGYPNSASSQAAAMDLAAAYRDKQDWENTRRVLWWLYPRAKGDVQARTIADMAKVCIALKRFPSAVNWAARGVRQYKDLVFNSSWGDKLTFADIRTRVASAGAGDVNGRLPVWHGDPARRPEMDSTPMDTANVLVGSLLTPIETSPALRQPNFYFVQSGQSLMMYASEGGKDASAPLATIQLPQNQATVLLGATPQTAVFLQSNIAIGIDLKTQKTWTHELPRVPAMADRAPSPNQGTININGRVIQANNGPIRIVNINGNQMVIDGNGQLIPLNNLQQAQQGSDPEMVRRAVFAAIPQANFSTARMLGNRLVIAAGNQLTAINISTGESSWKDGSGNPISVTLPSNQVTAIGGNEDILMAQLDSPPSASTFYVVDADSGKFRKQFNLESERALWRAVGDDGTLFVVTDQSASAYDLVGDQNRALWRRSDIQTRFAGATALTLDGLIVVDNSMNAMCLSLESGEMRWPAPARLPLDVNAAPTIVNGSVSPSSLASVLRSTVDGDTVFFQSPHGLAAVLPAQSDKEPLILTANYLNGTPPLLGLELSDLYLIELARGQTDSTTNAVQIIFHARSGLKLDLSEPLIKTAGSNEGPLIRAFQVIDGGIAFEVHGPMDGEVHIWRNKAPAK